MQAYRWTAERVLRELNSAPGGLSRKQAAARLAKHGENRLARKKGDSLWRRFMLQLSDPMILVLLAAAAVSAVLCVAGEQGGKGHCRLAGDDPGHLSGAAGRGRVYRAQPHFGARRCGAAVCR